MLWWKRGTLFFLSLVFFACNESEKDATTETISKQSSATLITEFIENIIHSFEGKESNLKESLEEVNTHFDHISVFDKHNSYDAGSIVLIADSSHNFDEFKKIIIENFGLPATHGSYQVWLGEINNKRLMEVSLFNHPTNNWMITIRRRSQE